MENQQHNKIETITLGGGCFWCLEAVFNRLRGVVTAISGYTAGHTPNPTYREVCNGDTGHAEAVQVQFDPDTISYNELLQVFFALHDPTQLNRQGHDIGSQYRSGIYYTDAAQQQAALACIAQLQAHYPAPIVTEVQAASTFYPAEAEHQQYFARNPQQGYCQAVIAPKYVRAQAQFARLWR